MRWEQGRATLEQMLTAKELQRLPPSREHADRLLAETRRHLASAREISDTDPQGAYQLLYDGVRKALTAVLPNEGLRPTTTGGHRAVYTAVAAQLDPPMGVVLRPFDRMRRQRHEIEYPTYPISVSMSWTRADEEVQICRLPRPLSLLRVRGRVVARRRRSP